MTDTPEITKEYLERIVKEPIDKFELRTGSVLGDGYTCAMHGVDVWRKSRAGEAPECLLIKCFPENPSRQEILDQGNSFRNELRFYDTIVPQLVEFQRALCDAEPILLPVPGFVHGNYVTPDERKLLEKPLSPLENCIVMPDLRQASNGAYRMRDRFLGFDYDHYRLAIEAHAKLHALSWAYKCTKNLNSLHDEWPFLRPPYELFVSVMDMMISQFMKSAEPFLDGTPEVQAGWDHLQSVVKSTAGLYYEFDCGQVAKGHTKDSILRISRPSVENEEPWEVLLHGDAHGNNMLFRYDEKSGRPVEVLLVDFQITRAGDPFSDLVYTLYISVTPEVRKKHMKSLLHVYYDTFEGICKRLQVPTFPGWSWEELNRRFHRAKVMGAYTGCIALPILLKNPEELKNLDQFADALDGSKGDTSNRLENSLEFFATLGVSKNKNPLVTSRISGMIRELREEGVL